MFIITDVGRQLVHVMQSYIEPCLLVQFRLHGSGSLTDFGEFVPFESMLELTRQGWTYVQQAGSRRLPSYKQGGPKIWYFHKRICGQYLRVLLSSEKLFSLGLQEIFHYQATQYYKSLLMMMKYPSQLNAVKPWQTHSYYKVLQQQCQKRGSAIKNAPTSNSTAFDMETDDIGGGAI